MDQRSSSSNVVLKDKERTTTEKAVVADWMERSGMSSENVASYENYSNEQLMYFVDQGDLNAMHVLGLRKLTTDGVEAAIPFARKEIIYGGLRGISTMANYLGPDMSSTLPVEEIKMQLMESTAYYRLYSMRAKIYFPVLFEETQVDMFKKYYKVENVFTNDDEVWMNNRAEELYEYYQSERNKLGLGDFDNEVPNEVKEFLGE